MSDDAVIPIADLLGRGEALTVAAMLDAAGIIVHVGAEYYTGVTVNIIAVGGFRLTVPVWQYADASVLIAEMLAHPEPAPYAFVFGVKALLAILLSPIMLFQFPVNPQARGDYYLAAPTVD